MSCVNIWHKLTQVDTRRFFQKIWEKIGIKGCVNVSMRELENYVDENFEKISKIFIEYKRGDFADMLSVLALFLSLVVFLAFIFLGQWINPFLGFVGIVFALFLFFYMDGMVHSRLSKYYTFITIKLKNGKKEKFKIDMDFSDVYKKLRVLIGNKLVKYGLLPFTGIPLGYFRLCEKHKDYLKKYLIFATFEDYKGLNDMYDELEKCRNCKYWDIGKFLDFGKIVLKFENVGKQDGF